MDYPSDFERLLIFTTVERMLARKDIPVNDTLIYEVTQVVDFFDSVIDSIYSIRDRSGPYAYMPHLVEMLEFMDYKLIENNANVYRQKRELGKAISEFKECSTKFRELGDNPRKFFSDESKIRDVYNISSKLKDFYREIVDRERLDEHRNSDD